MIKKFEAFSVGGSKREEIDLEYVRLCLIDLIESGSKVYYKYQYKKNDRWFESDFLSMKEIEQYFNDDLIYQKEIIGIKVTTYIEDMPDSNSEISDWCDKVKNIADIVVTSCDKIRDEYPDYYTEDYNMKYVEKLKFVIEVTSK
jgi:hypothetical protein